mgnify:FL=1
MPVDHAHIPVIDFNQLGHNFWTINHNKLKLKSPSLQTLTKQFLVILDLRIIIGLIHSASA